MKRPKQENLNGRPQGGRGARHGTTIVLPPPQAGLEHLPEDPHDHGGVVVDHEDGDPELLPDAADEIDEPGENLADRVILPRNIPIRKSRQLYIHCNSRIN